MVRSLNGRSVQHERLTDRELDVLRLLASRLSNTDIGRRFAISPTRVKFQVSNIVRRLEVSPRAEAVYAASKSGSI